MIAQRSPPVVADRPAPPFDSPVLRSLDALAAIEQHWETLSTELREHIPGLRSQRAFYDGAWVLGLRIGGRDDRPAEGEAAPGLAFSRLDVQIALDTRQGRAELTALCTVRNRDARRHALEVALDDEGHSTIETFLEQAVLSFADRYFDRS